MERRSLLFHGLAGAAVGLVGSLGLPDRARAQSEDYGDPDVMYQALATLPRQRIRAVDGEIDLVFTPAVPAAQRPAILGWIDRGIAAVVRYFGRFPVRHLGLLVLSAEGARVGHGTTYGHAGSAIRISVGREAEAAAFDADWVLVHEMVHLAFPNVPRRHLWIQEGSATYVEPFARVQAGQLVAATVWQQLRRALPQGLPQAGDEGLDVTHTWGRTYWGGALFCLLADVEMLRLTGGRRGLQQALVAIARASGGNSTRWPLEQALRVGDEAVQHPVLSTLYRRMRDQAVTPDLDELFRQLGVRPVAQGGLDEEAPLASVRRAITAGPTG